MQSLHISALDFFALKADQKTILKMIKAQEYLTLDFGAQSDKETCIIKVDEKTHIYFKTNPFQFGVLFKVPLLLVNVECLFKSNILGKRLKPNPPF